MGKKRKQASPLFGAEEHLLWKPLKENKHGAIWCCLYNQFFVKNFTLNGNGDLDSVDHACEFKDYAVARVIFLQIGLQRKMHF